MLLEFYLEHDTLGSLQINEPDGWADLKLTLERDVNFKSLTERFEGSFIFYGDNGVVNGGIERILEVERDFGPDAKLIFRSRVSFDGYNFEDLFEGLLQLYGIIQRPDNKIQVPVIPNDFWTKFINRLDTPVDIQSALTLDDENADQFDPINLVLTSQTINKTTLFSGHTGDNDTAEDCQVATTGNITLSGIQTIDGSAGFVSRRVVVKDNTDQKENGIYVESVGAWSRSSDANTNTEIEFLIVKVTGGATNSGKTYKQQTAPITIGVSNIVFAEYNYVDDYELFDGPSPGSSTGTYQNYYASAVATERTLDEIQSTYNIPFILIDQTGTSGTDYENIGDILEITSSENGTILLNYDADLRFRFAPTASGGTGITGWEWLLKISAQVNDGPVFDLSSDQYQLIAGASTNYYTDWNFSIIDLIIPDDVLTEHLFIQGDRIRIFYRLAVRATGGPTGTWDNVRILGGIVNQTVSFKLNSKYADSGTFSFLIHDAAGQICDRIISEDQSFYSEHLGSGQTLYRQYDADGCGWKYAITKGLQIRQYSLIEKPFFQSFNQWWKGINPVLCLGLGYELINGLPVIRVEQMEHFYDDSGVSINISNVRDITRNYDQEVIFKTIKVGYSKWQSEDISGIDDPQTKHTYATRLQKAGVDLNLESDFIAASLAIETTRRTTRIKSADYKFDNDTFLIAINPIPVDVSPETSPDVNDYVPELDENFSSITNLLNSETRYNSRITPARNLMRWIRYISGCLQAYIDSKFKFSSGEGNYDMTSDMSNVSDGCEEIKTDISEKQDLPVYNDPLHLSLSYDITIPLEWEDYLLIRNNRKKAIGISQTTTDHVKFFIDTLEYELVKGLATIKAWPVEFFDINVIETTSNHNVCFAVPGDCEDAYLTEDGYEFITEDGNCLILN